MGAIASRQHHNHHNNHHNSGSSSRGSTSASIRDSVRENINTSNHEPHNDTSIIDRNRHNHSQADTVDTASTEDWSKVTARFRSQLLDESYLVYPIRGSTIEAADQYPATGTCHNNNNNVNGNTATKQSGMDVSSSLSLEDDNLDSIDNENNNQQGQQCLMPGTHKHLGGAYDPTDGCIYGVPANARSVLCLYPNTKLQSPPNLKTKESNSQVDHYLMKTIPLPKDIQEVRMKWLRGIFAHGYMWAIPSWAPKVLCVDIDAYWGRRETSPNGIVQLLPLPADHPSDQTIWQWHGAGINHEQTAIYCIPSNAHQVLKVDLATKTTSLIPVDIDASQYPDLDVATLTNKWYGGIVGADNAVYGIPYRASAVLRIDTKTESAKVVGPNYGCGLYNWHGGICVKGKIYAHPSHAETVLVIDTNQISEDGEPAITELEIHRADYDTDQRKNYKWLGGSVGVDGNIYCPACDTSAVLKIDTTTDHCSTYGFAGTSKNKWQGGVLSKSRDGCIYCIPASGTQILRIPTHPDTLKTENDKQVVQLLGDLPVHKDKWQGGYEGKDGCLYFIPENGYRILKVIPPLKPPKIVNGKLPDHDVRIEML